MNSGRISGKRSTQRPRKQGPGQNFVKARGTRITGRKQELGGGGGGDCIICSKVATVGGGGKRSGVFRVEVLEKCGVATS